MEATEAIKRRYNRTSVFYDCMDRMIKDEWRKAVIDHAADKVLEVGVGTGQNFRFYPKDCQVIGIDFSPGMLNKAKERAKEFNNIKVCEMDVENLQFPDNTFDTIIATCVFCSVPNPVKGLEELRRVCKPEGKLVFLEHIRSHHRLMGALMDLFNPVVVRLIGANINRDTLDNIEQAGLRLSTVQTMGMDILKLMIAEPIK